MVRRTVRYNVIKVMDIVLSWARDALGYRLEKATPEIPPTNPNQNALRTLQQRMDGKRDDLVLLPEGFLATRPVPAKPERVVRQGGSLIPYNPIISIDTILHAFLNTSQTPEGVLSFVDRFGPLSPLGHSEYGEHVHPVIDVLAGMTEIVDAMAGLDKDEQRRSFKKFFGVDGARVPGIELHLVFDESTQALRMQQAAQSLLIALWLRLCEVLMSNIVLRRCGHCGALFTAGLGTGRHLNAKFCTDEHRILFNSLKRTPRAA